MASIRFRLREVFGLDLRSLAVLRIGLGLSVLLTVASYAPNWRDLVGDDGVISLDVAYGMAGPEIIPYIAPFWIAPRLMEWLLPVALMLFGLALAVGFYTRVAAAGCWYAIYCLQVRNPSVANFSDDIVLRLLFWGVFLPLAARFSIDALRARNPSRSANPYVSVASAGLLIQVASVYFVSGFFKFGSDWQRDLTAIWYVLEGHFRGTEHSAWLLPYPRLAMLATWITPRFEVAIGLALFVPIAPALVRTLAVGLIVGFHLMLALFIPIGAAPFVCSIGALALLPGAFWDRLGLRYKGAFLNDPIAIAEPAVSGWMKWGSVGGQLVLTVPLLVMLAYDVLEITRTRHRQPVFLHWLGETLRVTQEWSMFSPNPAHFDGWFIAPGVLANGSVVDLLRDGAAVGTEPPATMPWLGQDYRMANFREDVRNRVKTLGTDYGRWLCRSWNRSHSGGERLERFEFVWMHIDLSRGVRGDPKRMWLIRSQCDPASGS